ncbi:MAG: ABC transporter permease subunit [Pseudomonadota bacterium]|nr:ABC transporter permease subunit [Pseudomonadota bacterium]
MRLINRRPGRGLALALTVLPFAAVVIAYSVGSDIRLAENPSDKLLPSFRQIGDAINRMAFETDKRSGDILLWVDTWASLVRLGIGVGISASAGLVFGLLIGLLPMVRAALAPFVAVLSLIPPLAILPILFIVFGLDELSKVALIVIGIAPFMMRDLSQRVLSLPAEQLVKAQTLGASTWQIATRVALPQVLPHLIQSIRLSLGPAWLFLIAAEAIAATAGLGYRIFLVRRFFAMDVIIPYVVWITLLAFIIDYVLKVISRRGFRWAHLGGESL